MTVAVTLVWQSWWDIGRLGATGRYVPLQGAILPENEASAEDRAEMFQDRLLMAS